MRDGLSWRREEIAFNRNITNWNYGGKIYLVVATSITTFLPSASPLDPTFSCSLYFWHCLREAEPVASKSPKLILLQVSDEKVLRSGGDASNKCIELRRCEIWRRSKNHVAITLTPTALPTFPRQGF